MKYKLTSGAGNASTKHVGEIDGLVPEYVAMGATTLNNSSLKLVSGHLDSGESHSFDLGIKFDDTLSDQSDEQNATFKGKLTAEATTVKPS